ncbi:phosphofructokinase family protein [Actinidia rufa]|uniref:Phosphofructokinase family protein n=1 Tax=Actinidia rufa TaxID=165716 RepID=A0A7J0DP30_9ERIC|nr:phosphofructokinase family protein [Actinidia rufa]
MGHKASHVALECTLQSHPNTVILGEKVSASKLALFDLTKQICDVVQCRAEQDKYHGVILLPEGLIESIPEEIHGLLRQGVSLDNISSQLTPWASALFEFLPPFIRKQFLLFPESDDSAQLSQIETEKLLAHLVEAEVNKSLAMMTVKHYGRGPGTSSIGKPALHPAAVDLRGKAYMIVIGCRLLRQKATRFLMDNIYRNSGRLQFDGPGADAKPVTLRIEDQDYMGCIKKLREYLDKVRTIVKPGCSQDSFERLLWQTFSK